MLCFDNRLFVLHYINKRTASCFHLPVIVLVANCDAREINRFHIIYFHGHVTLVLEVNSDSVSYLTDEQRHRRDDDNTPQNPEQN